MPPWLGGGHMIKRVGRDESTYMEPPARFEAGTSNIAEAIGLGAAVDFLGEIGMDEARAHGREIAAYALERLGEVEGLTRLRPAGRRAAGRRASRSTSRACTRTTSRRSSAARVSASAPATTARSR